MLQGRSLLYHTFLPGPAIVQKPGHMVGPLLCRYLCARPAVVQEALPERLPVAGPSDNNQHSGQARKQE